jgi:hypothetical protein
MAETTQPPNWPSPRGPWPDVTDSTRLFDHGAWWCVNRAGHPDPEDGYPDVDRHTPWDECHSITGSFTGVRADVTGPPLELELYAAAPFRFGCLRAAATDTSITPRVVFECYSDGGSEPAELRFSLPLGEALRLARRLEHLVDEVSYPHRAPGTGPTDFGAG